MTASNSPAPAVDTVRRVPPPPTHRPAFLDAAPATPAADTSSIVPDGFMSTARITAWVDPLVDEAGHDPRSRYVEQFWLGVLGPTATWLMRRFAEELDAHPSGVDIDLPGTAQAMGLSYTPGRSSPFAKALQRCAMFALAHQTADGFAVRRRVPSVAPRHVRRMPEDLQRAHAAWQRAALVTDDIGRAHHIAVAMLEAGDAAATIEQQLTAIGVSDATAAQVADNAARL